MIQVFKFEVYPNILDNGFVNFLKNVLWAQTPKQLLQN